MENIANTTAEVKGPSLGSPTRLEDWTTPDPEPDDETVQFSAENRIAKECAQALLAGGVDRDEVRATLIAEFPLVAKMPGQVNFIISKFSLEAPAASEPTKPAGREDATRGRGRPADPKKAGARKHRQSPVIAAYLKGIEAVRVALAGEQSSGLFGPIPPDGRDTKALFLATELLFNCGGHESRYKGYAFPRWKSLAKELNVSRATLARYSAALFAKTKCFVKVKAPNNFLRIYPALDGVPIHPKAPGYDRAKIEAAIAGLPSARNGN